VVDLWHHIDASPGLVARATRVRDSITFVPPEWAALRVYPQPSVGDQALSSGESVDAYVYVLRGLQPAQQPSTR